MRTDCLRGVGRTDRFFPIAIALAIVSCDAQPNPSRTVESQTQPGASRTVESQSHVGDRAPQIACEAAAPRDSFAQADSAGIRISVNYPSSSAVRNYEVSAEPALTLGDQSGRDARISFGTIVGAVRLSTGEIVVADSQAKVVSVYRPDGVFARQIGRSGDGPGEFQSIARLNLLRGDTLVVWDRRRRRLVRYASAGRSVSFIQLRDSTVVLSVDNTDTTKAVDVPQYVTHLDDGRIILGLRVTTSSGAGAPAPSRGFQTKEQRTALAFADSSGKLIRILGAFRAEDIYMYMGYDQARNGTWLRDGLLPLSPPLVVAVTGGRLFIGESARFEIQVRDAEGQTHRLIRLCRSAIPATMELKKRAGLGAPERTDSVGKMRSLEILAAMKYPDMVPQFGSILVDKNHLVWVGDYASGVSGREWNVFSAEGRLIATVKAPRDLTVFDIGEDYILGVFTDGDGRQSVRLHRLTRSRTSETPN